MKKLSIILAGLLLTNFGVAHANYMYNNAWTLNLEGGYGKNYTPNTSLNNVGGSHKTTDFVYSTGIGYNWSLQNGLFAGVEADYLNNGVSKYTGSGQSGDTGSLNVNSNAYAAMATMNYYIGSNWNWFTKFGYAYVQNHYKYSGSVTSNGYTLNNNYTAHDWEPIGVFGVGYAIPLSDNVGLNIYSDITWISGDNPGNFDYINSNNYVNNKTAQVLAAKVGLQMYF